MMEDSGRIQLPPNLHKWIGRFGKKVFVSTLDGESIVIYPLPLWNDHCRKLRRKKRKKIFRTFMIRANFRGLITEMDNRGRINPGRELIEKTGLKGKLIIEEKQDHIRLVKANNSYSVSKKSLNPPPEE